MNRKLVVWMGAAFGMLLMACSSSSSAQRPDENAAMESQRNAEAGMDHEGCGCPMDAEGGCEGCGPEGCDCPMHAEGGCPGCGPEGHRHGGGCPMGKSCPFHNLPEGSRAIVEDTPNGATIRLEAPGSDEASVEALRKAARKVGKMIENGCPMKETMGGSTPPPPAQE